MYKRQNLTSLDQFSEPITWAVEKEKVATHPDEIGPSLRDIESSWNEEKLHVETHLGLLAWIGIIVGSAVALVILVCSCKCGWECYTRKRNREQLRNNKSGITFWLWLESLEPRCKRWKH